MSTILLTIGSNTFAKTNIDKAKRMLSFVFPDIIFSEPILTEPEDDKYSYLFRNVLATVNTELRPEEVIDKIKQTERAVGRTPRDKYLGKVVIDIDLVKYGDNILRPQDFEREYVQRLLPTLDTPKPLVEEVKEDAVPMDDVTETPIKDLTDKPEDIVDADQAVQQDDAVDPTEDSEPSIDAPGV